MNKLQYLFPNLVRGVAAGILGTALMTVAHLLLNRFLTGEDSIAPSHPESLVARFWHKVGAGEMAAPEKRGETSVMAHFAYGGFWGALYAISRTLWPMPFYIAGTLLSVITWVAGFVGWLPAIGQLPAPWHRPRERVISSLISHFAYGLGTVLAYGFLTVQPEGESISVDEVEVWVEANQGAETQHQPFSA